LSIWSNECNVNSRRAGCSAGFLKPGGGKSGDKAEGGCKSEKAGGEGLHGDGLFEDESKNG
jgi:hypothetical protein